LAIRNLYKNINMTKWAKNKIINKLNRIKTSGKNLIKVATTLLLFGVYGQQWASAQNMNTSGNDSLQSKIENKIKANESKEIPNNILSALTEIAWGNSTVLMHLVPIWEESWRPYIVLKNKIEVWKRSYYNSINNTITLYPDVTVLDAWWETSLYWDAFWAELAHAYGYKNDPKWVSKKFKQSLIRYIRPFSIKDSLWNEKHFESYNAQAKEINQKLWLVGTMKITAKEIADSYEYTTNQIKNKWWTYEYTEEWTTHSQIEPYLRELYNQWIQAEIEEQLNLAKENPHKSEIYLQEVSRLKKLLLEIHDYHNPTWIIIWAQWSHWSENEQNWTPLNELTIELVEKFREQRNAQVEEQNQKLQDHFEWEREEEELSEMNKHKSSLFAEIYKEEEKYENANISTWFIPFTVDKDFNYTLFWGTENELVWSWDSTTQEVFFDKLEEIDLEIILSQTSKERRDSVLTKWMINEDFTIFYETLTYRQKQHPFVKKIINTIKIKLINWSLNTIFDDFNTKNEGKLFSKIFRRGVTYPKVKKENMDYIKQIIRTNEQLLQQLEKNLLANQDRSYSTLTSTDLLILYDVYCHEMSYEYKVPYSEIRSTLLNICLTDWDRKEKSKEYLLNAWGRNNENLDQTDIDQIVFEVPIELKNKILKLVTWEWKEVPSYYYGIDTTYSKEYKIIYTPPLYSHDIAKKDEKETYENILSGDLYAVSKIIQKHRRDKESYEIFYLQRQIYDLKGQDITHNWYPILFEDYLQNKTDVHITKFINMYQALFINFKWWEHENRYKDERRKKLYQDMKDLSSRFEEYYLQGKSELFFFMMKDMHMSIRISEKDLVEKTLNSDKGEYDFREEENFKSEKHNSPDYSRFVQKMPQTYKKLIDQYNKENISSYLDYYTQHLSYLDTLIAGSQNTQYSDQTELELFWFVLTQEQRQNIINRTKIDITEHTTDWFDIGFFLWSLYHSRQYLQTTLAK